MNIEMKRNRFITLIADNANWVDLYFDYLSYRAIGLYGNRLIKDYHFYIQALAIQDQEEILINTGNLDADL